MAASADALAEVHVWLARLEDARSDPADLARTLSANEAARAERYAGGPLRDRYVARRGLLRTIVGAYLGVAPGEVRLTAGPHGKPALDASPPGRPLNFSLAHSAGLALYAICASHQVGVDVEGPTGALAADHLVLDYCSTAERAVLEAMPPDERQRAFVGLWVRKEAALKASGEGLSVAPARVEVLDTAGRLLPPTPGAGVLARWRLRDLDLGGGCCAAVAVDVVGADLAATLGQPPALVRSLAPVELVGAFLL